MFLSLDYTYFTKIPPLITKGFFTFLLVLTIILLKFYKLVNMKQRTIQSHFIDNSLTTEKDKPTLNTNFAGIYYKVLKFLVRTLTKKYDFLVDTPTQPKIYVCRHKNTTGVITLLKSATFDMHPLSLSVFTNFSSCFSHLFNYTFTKRYKIPKIFAVLPAFLSTLVVFPLTKSVKAVPVYRNSSKSFLTLKKATKYLLSGESLVVFPDVDYTSVKNHVGDIYGGFLHIETLYHKACGKHVAFVPIQIDGTLNTITAKGELFLNSQEEFSATIDKIKQRLI